MAPSLLDFPRPVKTYHTKTYDRISPDRNLFDGKDKVVLVTGGASGVGLSICMSFAQAGVKRIIITSRSAGPQAEARKLLETSFPSTEIVTSQTAVTDQPGMDTVMQSHGPIDVLVLCAAYSHQQVPDAKITSSEIDECFQTNVIGNLGIARSYLQQTAPPSGQRIVINVSSAALQLFSPVQLGYGPSKAAFAQMITTLSVAHPPASGVRMFSYHPGAFYTPSAAAVGLSEDFMDWEDIKLPGDFAVWLASPESTFLNGRFVWAQWDVDELLALKPKLESDPGFLTVSLLQ